VLKTKKGFKGKTTPQIISSIKKGTTDRISVTFSVGENRQWWFPRLLLWRA